ncbi:MAG: hypothetical protein Hyperionvirus38_13 [Hyperionvirus sp.]|uniref:DOT1 domain-containing protein n=1 Tax=Hyperionvirus sp. TaxID=2487770 RepID=A0A3G5AC17_9VIRU|nr:MAG: hypothetical protein Hyperionvirus38_13 [Hyperionvirus sp.]
MNGTQRIYKFVYLNVGGGEKKLTADEIEGIYSSIKLLTISDGGVGEKKFVNSTYGEMTFEGVEKLIAEAEIKAGEKFIDLGSGNGRAAMQVFMNAEVAEAMGVEFHPERFMNAEAARKKLFKLRPELLDSPRLLTYQLQNIKDVYFLGDKHVVYMCSTCYPEELLGYVYEAIKDSKNIRCVITHKKYDRFKEFLPREKTAVLCCSWSKSLTWYLYLKS